MNKNEEFNVVGKRVYLYSYSNGKRWSIVARGSLEFHKREEILLKTGLVVGCGQYRTGGPFLWIYFRGRMYSFGTFVELVD